MLYRIHLVMLKNQTKIGPKAGYTFAGLYKYFLLCSSSRPSHCLDSIQVSNRKWLHWEGAQTYKSLNLNCIQSLNFKLYSHIYNLCVLAVYIWFVNVSTVTLSNIKTHLLLLQTWPYPSLSNLLEGLHFSVSLGSLVLFFSRWHISVGIISLLQDAAAFTMFMYLCTRHTCTTACMYLNAA